MAANIEFRCTTCTFAYTYFLRGKTENMLKDYTGHTTGFCTGCAKDVTVDVRADIRSCPECGGHKFLAWNDFECPKCGGIIEQDEEYDVVMF